MNRDIALGMATSYDGQQEQGDWFDPNYEQRRLQPADSPVALPPPRVGLNATLTLREMICELRTGELPRRKTSPGLGLKLVWW